jgi:hypothetical protein
VPEDPGDPFPGMPPDPASPADQDQILAWEMAAFPAEEEPDWEALELLEYLDDTDPGDLGTCSSGPVSCDTPTIIAGAADIPAPATADAEAQGTAACATANGTYRDQAGCEFAHGGAADTMVPGAVLAALADRVWQDGLEGLDDDELTGCCRRRTASVRGRPR